MKRKYQENVWYIRYAIWLKWMPYAYLRGIFWTFRYNDFRHIFDNIDYSIGDIQSGKMYWIYSAKECMNLRRK